MNERIPINAIKARLHARRQQIAIWSSLCSSLVAELEGDAGFDAVVIDTEHSPNELPQVLAQLQALAGTAAGAVVRLAANDPVLAKRCLDVGASTLLFPFVQSAQDAERAVRSTRYPPSGDRGVAGTTRANRFGRLASAYFEQASEEVCVMVQVESASALACVRDIATVAGVDAVFIGPSDLAASLGQLGAPTHPSVQLAIREALAECREVGQATAILAPNPEQAMAWIDDGVDFVAVGNDIAMLGTAMRSAAEAGRRRMAAAAGRERRP